MTNGKPTSNHPSGDKKYDTNDEAVAARRILGVKLTETRSTLGWY